MAHDVFISYPSKDKTVADAICAKLEEKKVRCWIAPRDIAAGQNFARSIINAIDNCKVFILVWSQNTNASEHILNEINRAFDQGKPIIPFRIQDVQPTPEMLYYFGRTHWLDALTQPLESHINTLIEIIFANLGIKQDETQVSKPEKTEGIQEPIKKKNDSDLDRQELKQEQSPAKDIEGELPGKEGQKPVSTRAGNEIVREHKLTGKKPSNKTIILSLGSILVITIAIILLRFTGFLSSKLPSVQDQNINTTTPTFAPVNKTNTPPPTATFTVTPTITATPLPDWATDFSEPILSVIRDREPDFKDDFSTKNSDWYLTSYPSSCPTLPKIMDGRLILFNRTDCFVFAYLANRPLLNWVFSVDMWVNAKISYNIGFNHNLNLQEDGSWHLSNCKKECTVTKEGTFPMPTDDRPVKMTFISLGERNAIYFDGVPTVFYYDFQSPTTDILFMQSNGQNYGTIIPVEIDNFQVWDLDKIENLSQLLGSQ